MEKTIEICEPGTSHYLPRRPNVKENRETSKVKIAFDGSLKYKSELSIYKRIIKIRILLGTPALRYQHRNFLRFFLWFGSIFDIDPSIIVYKFTRVIFGLSSSPFLTKSTLKVSFSKLLQQQICEHFILARLLVNLYVDGLASSFNEEK